MSSEDCKNLIDLAKEFKLLIVCDDVYNLLWYQGESCPKRLLQWDKEGSNIISNGTFSKVLAPGVRVGLYFSLLIRMSHWRQQMADGAEHLSVVID